MDDAYRIMLYHFLHYAGIISLFTGLAILLMPGGPGKSRKVGLIFHGTGLFLLLLGGFGLMARMGYSYGSGWMLLKVVIWVFFAIVVVLAKKGILGGTRGWALTVLLGVLAAFLGVFKPF